MDGSEQRLVVYCLLALGTDADVAAALRDHYRGADPRVEVVVDRRVGDRRSTVAPPAAGFDRRQGSDRRRAAVPRALPALPPDLAERAGRLRWVQRMLPVGESLERLSTEEVVAAVRAGDPEAPPELYWRWYERMHSRLCVLLGAPDEADPLVGLAFGGVLDALETVPGVDAQTLLYAQ